MTTKDQSDTESSNCQALLQTAHPTRCTRVATYQHRQTGRQYCLQHMRIEAHGLFRINAVRLCSAPARSVVEG